MRVRVEEAVNDELVPVHLPDCPTQLHWIERGQRLPVLQRRGAKAADGEVVHRNAHVHGRARGGHARLQHPHWIDPLDRHGAQLRRPLRLLGPRLWARGRLLCWRFLAIGRCSLYGLLILAPARRRCCHLGHARDHVVHAGAHGLADGFGHPHDAVQEGGTGHEAHHQHRGRAELAHRLRHAHGREGLLQVGMHALQRFSLRLEVQLVVEVLLGLPDLVHLRRVQ
mmetsp:Transcript_110067/g.321949  ORF Transcript_110067/g.321949 Transcript_110067/m.321949 type:complete len:225 (-) Transcript_110067:562-1236(-)